MLTLLTSIIPSEAFAATFLPLRSLPDSSTTLPLLHPYSYLPFYFSTWTPTIFAERTEIKAQPNYPLTPPALPRSTSTLTPSPFSQPPANSECYPNASSSSSSFWLRELEREPSTGSSRTRGRCLQREIALPLLGPFAFLRPFSATIQIRFVDHTSVMQDRRRRRLSQLPALLVRLDVRRCNLANYHQGCERRQPHHFVRLLRPHLYPLSSSLS
jgi:hypothetical protein